MKLILCLLLSMGGYFCNAQQLKSDKETTKALLAFQYFTDSVEQLINKHKLSFDTVYVESSSNSKGFDTIVFKPSPHRKFFISFSDGGNVYQEAIEAQYYFVVLPNIACKVPNMTLAQRTEYIKVIKRFEGFLKD
jgi:hypothetical protein